MFCAHKLVRQIGRRGRLSYQKGIESGFKRRALDPRSSERLVFSECAEDKQKLGRIFIVKSLSLRDVAFALNMSPRGGAVFEEDRVAKGK